MVVIGSLTVSRNNVRRQEIKFTVNSSSEPLISSKESTKITIVSKFEEPIEVKINKAETIFTKNENSKNQNVLPNTVTNDFIKEPNIESGLLRTTIDSAIPLAIEVVGLEDYVQEDKIYVVIFPE